MSSLPFTFEEVPLIRGVSRETYMVLHVRKPNGALYPATEDLEALWAYVQEVQQELETAQSKASAADQQVLKAGIDLGKAETLINDLKSQVAALNDALDRAKGNQPQKQHQQQQQKR
jgi:chromosome segregation ATPase